MVELSVTIAGLHNFIMADLFSTSLNLLHLVLAMLTTWLTYLMWKSGGGGDKNC